MASVDEIGGADLMNDELTKMRHSLRSYIIVNY